MISRYIKSTEDSLTWTVFGALLHLPIETFWAILRDACFDSCLPAYCGEPEEIVFWPSWNPEHTDNVRRVEPDLFLRFKEFDLIIEAKRWDHNMQNRYQWEQEIQAYANVYGEDQKTVFLLAVGGLNKNTPETLPVSNPHNGNCVVCKSQWNRLLQSVMRQKAALEKIPFLDSFYQSQLRILQDLVALFAHYGFSTGRWYDDFPFDSYRIPRITYNLKFQ